MQLQQFLTYLPIVTTVAGLALFPFTSKGADPTEPLKPGDPAPKLDVVTSKGETVPLQSFYGKGPVVVYFYPKNDTPGCTTEACAIRDDFSEFKKLDAVVLGVSYDSVESHKKFIEKYELPFLLLSDQEKNISKAFGVKGLLFAPRVTFVIDQNEKIAWVNLKVNPKTHSKELREVLAGLQEKEKEE